MKRRGRGVASSPIQAQTPHFAAIPTPAAAIERHPSGLRLLESEERFPGVEVALGLMQWTASADGTLGDMAPWCAYTGQRPEEVRGWGWLDAVHSKDRSRVAKGWEHAVATGSPYLAEFRVHRADGVYRWLLARATPLLSADGRVREWAGACIDITERKQMEDDLRARNAQLEQGVATRGSHVKNADQLDDVLLIRAQTQRVRAAATSQRLRELLGQVEAAESQLRAVLEAAPDALVLTSRDGRIEMVNRQTEALFGYRREELVGQAVETLIPERYHAAHTKHRRRYAALPRARLMGAGLELYGRRKDGQEFPVEVSLSPAPSTGASHLVGIIRDVTERKRAETALQQAQQEAAARASQLEAILDAVADAVVVFDRDGGLLHQNPAARELLGLDRRAEGFPRTIGEVGGPLHPRDVHGQPLPEEQWPPNRALRGETLRGADATDVLLRTLDGHDVLVNESSAPVRDAQGQITGAVVILRDVTERRRLERQTHEALDALLAMAEALVQAPTEAAETTAAGSSAAPAPKTAGTPPPSANATAQRLVELAQRVLGGERLSLIAVDDTSGAQRPMATIRPNAAEARWWWASVPRFRMDDYVAPTPLARLRAGEVVLTDLTQAPTGSARDRPTYGGRAALVAPMRLREQLVGFLVLNYGTEEPALTAEEQALAGAVAKLAALVLERERLLQEREAARAHELALTEANRRMDEFLGVAAHELKAPVTTSTLAVQMAASRMKNRIRQVTPDRDGLAGQLQAVEELLARADHSMARLGRLMVNLLDVVRIRAGKLELQLEPCDLTDIVRDAIDEQHQLAPTRAIHLHLPARRSVLVVADPVRIEEVVANYLSNALKYSAEDKPVTVELRVEGEWARVSVRDKGPGLSAEEQERVWERFHRAQGVHAVSGGGIGLGLGLHICKTIVERHQGQVGVRGTPGKGSTFWFTLPVAPPTI